MSDAARDPGRDEPIGTPRATEDPIVRDDEPQTPSDPRRSTRTGRRAGSRILVGMVAGLVVGVLLGLLIGAVVSEPGSRGFWAAAITGGIFGFVLGGFWGGLSGLGPPEVENDPLPPASRDGRAERPGSEGTTSVG
jgi:hypothetical protein